MNEPVEETEIPNYNKSESSGGCLKTFVWFLPSFVVPIIVGLSLTCWPIGVVLALVFLIWMGNLTVEDSNAQPNAGEKRGLSKKWRVAIYVVLQVIWIPLFLAAVFWGFCMVSGFHGF